MTRTGYFLRVFAKMASMSLRGEPLEADATLPDGSTVHVRIGVPDDGYIKQRDLDTVAVELSADGEHVAAVNTLLDADESSEALGLLREIVAGLESGELSPTAGSIEPLADRLR
jgi:hypothetical protein